ncbi:MFS transporter [Microbacterium sp. No. 7]|uniref:MFS transporter n=1 Tax=Microbacterium sp. No. 7 TaxID=1714373 RepID=UPI0006ED38ED|nr:MFS transporter [Microbacterium sp. No. 7]ALJ19943.1 hypothetical protein AOA12_08490 [Microbacterium sp. No. 7]
MSDETTVPASVAQTRPTIAQAIDAMPRVGLNRGAWFALFLAYFFTNYEISVFALTIPGIRNSLGLETADFGLPVTLNLVGYAIGAYAFGYIADRKGRQLGLLLTFITLGVGGLATAFVWDGLSLALFRFVAGCGMGAVLALCTAYIGEMAPQNRRGQYLARIYLWGAFLLLASGLLSLPLLEALPDSGWRVLLGFGGAVLLVVPFINSRSLMESPRWLAEHGRIREASVIAHRMRGLAGLPPEAVDEDFAEELKPVAHGPVESPLRSLLRRPLLGRLLVVLGFWFIFYIGMYAFTSYLPLILEGIGVSTSNALIITVLTRATPIVAALIVVFLIERMERRTIVIGGVLLFAAAVALVISGLGEWAATAGALLATFGIAVMATPAYTYTAEVFPTRARGTAASICDGIGHLGGAVAPLIVLPILVQSGAVPAGIAIIAAVVLSAVIIAFGVRTRNRSLEEIAS